MEQALIGLGGLLIGLFISEYFRRRSRVEVYAQGLFQKRLNVYEKLYSKLVTAREVASDVIENPSLTPSPLSRQKSGVYLVHSLTSLL